MESPEPEKKFTIPQEYWAFQDVFSKEAATKLPPHRAWDCAVEPLPGAKLTKGRVYPLSIPEQAAMEEYIQKALRQGFIRPSTSPAASSFFFVSKKDGGLRPFIDYRTLNSQTVKFRILYLWFQLPLRNSVGLVSSPNWTCEAPTNEVFRKFLHQFVIIYIDDILIYSQNQAEHCRHVEQVLQKLREHHLYLKLEKCEFHRTTIQFLGYVISTQGVQMDNNKLQAIRDWSMPSSVKELQRFLGFANFYR